MDKSPLLPVDQLPLVGMMEICQAAGVQRPVATMWRSRYETFPVPVAELHTGPVFWWPAVKQWLMDTDRAWDAGWTKEQVRGPGRTWSETASPSVARSPRPRR